LIFWLGVNAICGRFDFRLWIVKFIDHQTKHSSLNCSSFQVMYDYKVIFDIHIENNAIEEKVSSAKERIKQLQDVQNTLTQQ